MSKITAFGSYSPERIIDNKYFEEILETSDEWITSRTGIKARRFVNEEEINSDICVKAVEDLKKNSGINVDDVDFIIVCTTTPDQIMPNTASQVQRMLNVKNAGCIDIFAACSGFVYGLQIAHGFVNSGVYKKVLVLGSEVLSKAIDFEDRVTCILFGDGTGAAIVEPSEEEHFLAFNSGTNGNFGQDLYLSYQNKTINSTEIIPDSCVRQNGKTIFKWAVGTIPGKIRELLDEANLTLDDIDWIVPHSANLRILEGIAKSLGVSMDRLLESVSDHGNTSAATVPLAIAKGIKAGKVKPGQTLLMIGFGGGVTFAGAIVKW